MLISVQRRDLTVCTADTDCGELHVGLFSHQIKLGDFSAQSAALNIVTNFPT